MKKELIISLLFALCLITVKSFAAEKSALTGSWKCNAENVAEEYKSSTIIISEKEGKLSGTVKFDNGVEIPLNYVKHNGKDVKMSIYVEGTEVLINCKLEGSKMTGTADTPDGTVSLTATKAEQKK